MVLTGAGLLVVRVVTKVSMLKANPATFPKRNMENEPARVDFITPDLKLQDMDGQPISLGDYRGLIVLVNNWATWCPPCQAEMPIFEAYYRDRRDKGSALIGINAGEPATLVADFIVRHSHSFPVWLDPTNGALNRFRNNYLPSSYLNDLQGDFTMAWSGAVDRES